MCDLYIYVYISYTLRRSLADLNYYNEEVPFVITYEESYIEMAKKLTLCFLLQPFQPKQQTLFSAE